MLPCRAGAGALEQPRQRGEHRGRIALGGRRLADRQADLAPRHRDARDRVHHQQHVACPRRGSTRRSRSRPARRWRAPAPAGRWSRPRPPSARRPSGPRSRSMNSRTSRPRSPSSAITLTSAVVCRAIMPSSTLLPTPLPAKMPMRWPRPEREQPVDARARRCRAARGCAARSSGLRRLGASSERAARRPIGPEPVDRAAEPVEHAAEQAVADVGVERAAERDHHGARDGCPRGRRAASAGRRARGSPPPGRACRGGRRARCGRPRPTATGSDDDLDDLADHARHAAVHGEARRVARSPRSRRRRGRGAPAQSWSSRS